MMCTNDPEAGINYCSRRFFIFRVKNDQIHQKIDLGAVLALDAKRRVRVDQMDLWMLERVVGTETPRFLI